MSGAGKENMDKFNVPSTTRVRCQVAEDDRRIHPRGAYSFDYYTDKNFVMQILQLNLQPYLDEERPPFPHAAGGTFEVRRLMSIYRQWKSLKSHWDCVWTDKRFEDVVVYCMAFLCYSWQVRNSFVVSEVLTDIYRCYGNFMPLFQQSMSHPRTMLDVWSTTHFRPMEVKNIPPFSYFVYHATQSKLRFREIHFVDWRLNHPNAYRPCPVYLAASLGEVDLLKYLLQYGARLSKAMCSSSASWMTCLIVKLLTSALRVGVLDDLRSWNIDRVDFIPQRARQDILCVRILLRAIPQISISELQFIRNNFWRKHFFSPVEFVREMSDNGLVPKLKYRFLEPPELKHSCRVVIREHLRQNWQLPHGTDELHIPHTLIDYLNLEED